MWGLDLVADILYSRFMVADFGVKYGRVESIHALPENEKLDTFIDKCFAFPQCRYWKLRLSSRQFCAIRLNSHSLLFHYLQSFLREYAESLRSIAIDAYFF